MNLYVRVVGACLLLALLPAVTISITSYQSARHTIEEDTYAGLAGVNLLKEREIVRWIDDRNSLIVTVCPSGSVTCLYR